MAARGPSPRDRSLVSVSALAADGRAAQPRGRAGRALHNGLRPGEAAEDVARPAFHAGWPRAMSAVLAAQTTLADRARPAGDPAGAARVD